MGAQPNRTTYMHGQKIVYFFIFLAYELKGFWLSTRAIQYHCLFRAFRHYCLRPCVLCLLIAIELHYSSQKHS